MSLLERFGGDRAGMNDSPWLVRVETVWRGATGSDVSSYRVAVDREGAAAPDLQRLTELTKPCHEELALSE